MKTDSSSDRCQCCGAEVQCEPLSVADASGKMLSLNSCHICHAFTPLYPTRFEAITLLKQQVEFHETFWKNCTSEDLRQVSEELHSVICHYENNGILSCEDRTFQTVLELGCGRGCLLNALIHAGYRAQGSEPSQDLTRIARSTFGFHQNTLHTETIDDTTARWLKSGEKADVIFLWHVFEHVSSPIDMLASLDNILSDKGAMVIQVPLLRTRYLYPEHLCLFSPSTPAFIASTLAYTLSNVEIDLNFGYISFVLKKPNIQNQPKMHIQHQIKKTQVPSAVRAAFFETRKANRYWWYNHSGAKYLPPALALLTEEEWSIMKQWYDDTEKEFASPGELSIPGISLLTSLIAGNNLSAVVQCGHYVGYSTLLLGFLLRYMQNQHSLYSIDIDSLATSYTQKWLDLADLNNYVNLSVADSAAPDQPEKALSYFGQKPQLLFIDSSHQYAHTLRELDLWFPHLASGAFIVLHDVSQFATSFDASGEGGVYRAILEWCDRNHTKPLLMNNSVRTTPPSELIYRDGCGLGIFQKAL